MQNHVRVSSAPAQGGDSTKRNCVGSNSEVVAKRVKFSERPFAACCVGELPRGDETSRERLIRTLDTFRADSSKMPGFISMNLLEAYPLENAQHSLADEGEGSAEKSGTQTEQTLVISLWENETLQQNNFFEDHTHKCLKSWDPLFTAYPKFSFWVQLNGKATYRRKYNGIPLATEELEQPYSISACSGDSDFIVLTDWTPRNQVQMDACLPFLFELRKIAWSQRIKTADKSKPDRAQAGGKSDQKETTEDPPLVACRENDVYLAHNVDSPNEFRECVVWKSKAAYDNFMQLPSVQGIHGILRTKFCDSKNPRTSSWKKMRMHSKEEDVKLKSAV